MFDITGYVSPPMWCARAPAATADGRKSSSYSIFSELPVTVSDSSRYRCHSRIIRCLQHADSKQDLKARSHPWRLPRVSVPFAGSEHHKAALPAHAVHAVLSRRRSARAQGFKLQCRRVRAMPVHAVHQDPPWLNFDGALHLLKATCCGTGTGGKNGEERQGRFKASLSRT